MKIYLRHGKEPTWWKLAILKAQAKIRLPAKVELEDAVRSCEVHKARATLRANAIAKQFTV